MTTLPGTLTAPLALAAFVRPFVATFAASASPSAIAAVCALTARRVLSSSTVWPIVYPSARRRASEASST